MTPSSTSTDLHRQQPYVRAAVYGIVLGLLGLLVNPVLGFTSLAYRSEATSQAKLEPAIQHDQLMEVVHWEFAGTPLSVCEKPITGVELSNEFERRIKAARSRKRHDSAIAQLGLSRWAKSSLEEIVRSSSDILYGMETKQAIVRVLIENSREGDVLGGWCALQLNPEEYSMIELTAGNSLDNNSALGELLPIASGVKMLSGRNPKDEVVVEVINAHQSLADVISDWRTAGYTVSTLKGAPPSWCVTQHARPDVVYGVRPLSKQGLLSSMIQIQRLSNPAVHVSL